MDGLSKFLGRDWTNCRFCDQSLPVSLEWLLVHVIDAGDLLAKASSVVRGVPEARK
jgi:hypothetical protein